MRVLHVVKTADGAWWAAEQAAELVKLGVEVHVALPRAQGLTVQKWVDGGAVVHIASTDLPMRSPWSLPATMRRLRDLVSSVRPDLIHSHFFGSTVLLRLALGANHGIPRLFQVPGPLHLEHRFWRTVELSTAGSCDSWIASSRCIRAHYQAAGVSEERLYLSYYGTRTRACPTARAGLLRKRYGIADHMKVVGNANFIYPPKWYLGQRAGLKAHEDVIDALGLVVRQRPDVTGVLIGGTFTGSQWYECRLQARASAVGRGRILMTGYVPLEEIRRMWPDFDVAVHVPTSENCGGVVEPLLAAVPTIAGRVGGLPEVVIDGLTGKLVGIRDPQELARAVLNVLDDHEHYRGLARVGRNLVGAMFGVKRTALEVFQIYGHVLDASYPQLREFDSMAYLRDLAGSESSEEMANRLS
jgi:glycosyltransferase involved in cell wall biosynthesis